MSALTTCTPNSHPFHRKPAVFLPPLVDKNTKFHAHNVQKEKNSFKEYIKIWKEARRPAKKDRFLGLTSGSKVLHSWHMHNTQHMQS